MKRFIFCATLMALFTSCMKDDVVVDAVQRTDDFTATFADDTRADLDGTAVVWNADDHLTIFTKTSHNRQYKVKDLSANGRSATFEYVGYTGSDKTPITNNYAVYPYDATATISGDIITTTLASEQIYNAERDLTYALMSAKSSTNNFSFVNSGALLRFNISTILPDTFELNYIKVSSQSHNIAGEVTIDPNDHLAVVANNSTNEITLVEINETIDSDVKSFYIAMPAMSFEKSDLSVTFSFADGDKTFALPAFDLEQGKIKSIDYSIKDAEEFTGNTPGEDEPIATKPANNEIWYTNGSTTEPTTPCITNMFGANIVSNRYDTEKECWVIKFDGDVTTIGYNAFYKCSSLTSVTIPDSVTTIRSDAFRDCSSLTSVTIPDTVTTIGNSAFEGCSSLTSITIPDSVTTIEDEAFKGCSSLPIINSIRYADTYLVEAVDKLLDACNIKEGTRFIGSDAFRDCSSLTSITIPDNVTTIGGYAFYGCSSLTSITIPDSVTTIGHMAFGECDNFEKFYGQFASEDGNYIVIDGELCCVAKANLSKIVSIPDNIITIGHSAFSNCSTIEEVIIPNSVIRIESDAFYGCRKLADVTLGNCVQDIGSSAFCNTWIACITIPKSVKYIGPYAFNSTYSVYIEATTPPSIDPFSFPADAHIQVPNEAIDAYVAQWGEFYSNIY